MNELKEKINLLFRLAGKLNLYVTHCESTLQKKRVLSELETIKNLCDEIYNSEKEKPDYNNPTSIIYF